MIVPKLARRISWRNFVVAIAFVISSSALLLLPQFAGTANAAIVDNPNVYDCYLQFNGKVATAYNPDFSENTASGKMWKKCADQGYCTLDTVAQGAGVVNCKQALQNETNNEDILNAQIAPIIILVCGPESANTSPSTAEWYANCALKVKAQYKVCHDAALNHSDSDVAGSVASCMFSWAKDTYPDDKMSANDMKSAVNEGIAGGTKKSEEIDSAAKKKAQEACEAKGQTYDPASSKADSDGCVNPNDTATCTGGTLGWILCPLVELASSTINWAAPLIESQLRIEPMASGASQTVALQAVWQIIVGIANLLLVVAFLVVIFSQATSLGLSAYGIKKMLPRIIAAAILINLSFFICSILIDVFNVVGGSVKGIIDAGITALSNTINKAAPSSPADLSSALLAWVVGVAAAAAVGVLGYIVPLLVAGALAVLGMTMIIGMRQVLILLLIAVSPLAFAAMILPGTEPLFKKWFKSLTGLLVMYPIIMAILYGCSLISMIVLAAAGS